MKKILLTMMMCAAVSVSAYSQGKLTVSAGFQFPSSLNAAIGYEYPLTYGNAVELYGEAGNHWQKPVCHRFWDGYWWDAGLV